MKNRRKKTVLCPFSPMILFDNLVGCYFSVAVCDSADADALGGSVEASAVERVISDGGHLAMSHCGWVYACR